MVKDGIVLGKRYAVLSKIGAGGMADVYKGRDQMLNRYVAIKVLKKQQRRSGRKIYRLRRQQPVRRQILHLFRMKIWLLYQPRQRVQRIQRHRKGKRSVKQYLPVLPQQAHSVLLLN